MRLVIDAFKLVKGAGKSIGIYNLTRSLTEYLSAENKRRGCPHEIIVLGNSYNRRDMSWEGSTFVPIDKNPLDRATFTYWELFGVKKYARQYHADRILFPRGYRPFVYSGKDAIIIHDLIPFWYDEHVPGYLNRVENAYIMNRLKASIRHADKIITISDFSKQEIEALVPGSGARITRIWNGINDMPPFEREKTPTRPPYLAAVTTKMPHKNAAGILKAYAAYDALCRERGITPLELWIIGIPDIAGFDEGADLSPAARARIHCPGYLPEYADLCRLTAGARAFLFLSLAEGFGFPPLEAMQLGTPVICSSRTSLPEVVGDAGILVDPEDVRAVAEAILTLQGDDQKCRDLVQRGYENVKRFTWDSRTRAYWKALFGED
ncbi:MAG: glycosyltransferase family 4 protein [Lachnospiraceae bacterium]|jgi:glycosyltransferase involved in cell wall biosynthesis|nr:glycosyltransferase family 4 protein [Lachnospiraceae bacterium]MCI1397602.1 glycosyltransferase family 4 protein [Lachnospiraceae bacterium]MCI1422860.1 glycosyltransferase family 4 protein [Lachnospiraceae bacterium]MCI1451589.1 glycosyltransferase family 4 protein [Lachnospiraceae bacterium]